MPGSESRTLYISVSPKGDICFVQFNLAYLTDDQNIDALGRELFSLVEQHNARKVLLSMDRVQFVTSSVLGKLISLHRKLHRAEGRLVICDVQPEVEEVLRTSRLIDYFEVARDRGAGEQLLNRPSQ